MPASTSGGGALGIDIPGFQDLAPAVYIEKEPEPQVVPSTRSAERQLGGAHPRRGRGPAR